MTNQVAYTRQEIVEIVKMIRLELYNQGLHCGAGQKPLLKSAPSRATRSNAGVSTKLLPYALVCGQD